MNVNKMGKIFYVFNFHVFFDGLRRGDVGSFVSLPSFITVNNWGVGTFAILHQDGI